MFESRLEWYLWCCVFFSSRRRHTRLQGDWSSDVCSSDLVKNAQAKAGFEKVGRHGEAHRSEEHTSELQSPCNLVCRLLLEKKKASASNRVSTSRWHPPPRLASQGPAAAHRLGAGGGARREEICVLGAGDAQLFFFNDTATTEIYTLSLHDALPI